MTHRVLIRQGAFDAFVDVDSLLYVDPHLLPVSSHAEVATSTGRFESHFRDVLRLLKASKVDGDAAWSEACRRLTFPETPFVALGYAKPGSHGRAIGKKTAKNLTILAKQIVDVGIDDPELFALLGLLQEGVGPDLISDMTISIILDDLVAFSHRVAKALSLPTVLKDTKRGQIEFVSTTKGLPVLLIPADLLRKLPVAHSWSDVDTVASQNSALRARVNAKIGDTWKQATARSVQKSELRDAVIEHPELMRDLIAQYRSKKASGYDFKSDPAGVQVWYEVAEELASSMPLHLPSKSFRSLDELAALVDHMCLRFKELVEHNRLSRVLYNDDGTPRGEKTVQLFFFALAIFYCDANGLDLSPEADAGVGPVDFKMSLGSLKVTVEIKLTSNPNLVHGFEEQLPAYSLAEKTNRSVLLVVRNGEHQKRLKDLSAAQQRAKQPQVPKVVIVDGRKQLSASRRRKRS